MRNGLKVLGLSVLAALSLMAFTAGGAQAKELINSGEFLIVNGIGKGGEVAGLKTFKEAKILSETITGEQVGIGKLNILILELNLQCKAAAVTDADVLELGHGKAKIVFSGCFVTDSEGNEAACEIPDIVANVLALILLHGDKPATTEPPHESLELHPFVLFEPQPDQGGVFASVSPKGEFCTLPAADVTGSVVAEILTPLTHTKMPEFAVTKGTLELFPEDVLKYGENKGHLVTEARVRFTGANVGKEWSAH